MITPKSLPKPWRKACCPVCYRGLRSLKVVRKHALQAHGYRYPAPLKSFQEACYGVRR